jgi:hypothetical protein
MGYSWVVGNKCVPNMSPSVRLRVGAMKVRQSRAGICFNVQHKLHISPELVTTLLNVCYFSVGSVQWYPQVRMKVVATPQRKGSASSSSPPMHELS